jgi:hypothetical protein
MDTLKKMFGLNTFSNYDEENPMCIVDVKPGFEHQELETKKNIISKMLFWRKKRTTYLKDSEV